MNSRIAPNEQHYQYSNELFKKVFNASVNMMLIKNINGRIVDVNNSWLKNTGYSRDEVIGKTERDIKVWESDDILKKIENPRSGYLNNLEVTFNTKDGVRKIGLCNIQEIEVGSIKYYLEDINDVTKQKAIEEEMAKLDRFKLIGQMGVGISHEFRNSITTVRGFIQMLSGRRDLNQIKEYFDIMIEEIDRSDSIITEFLALSKDKALNLKRDNINICINRLFPMIQAGAFNDGKDVKLELSDVQDIYMDEGSIRQVIINLTRNAIEASPLNGTVTISTYQEGEEVVLQIKDEGEGIKEDILKEIATPFFTTKEDGTGMGLVICYGIVERHNAKITIETGINGTSFYIRFKSDNS